MNRWLTSQPIVLGGMLGVLAACVEDPVADDLPVVTTTVPFDIDGSSAQSGGDVTDDGGADVTVRGVCWSAGPEPTVQDDATEDGAGLGTFSSTLSGLDPDTTYHLRAYATNAVPAPDGGKLRRR